MNKQEHIVLEKTYNRVIEKYSFGDLSNEVCKIILKDGRIFSHYIEK